MDELVKQAAKKAGITEDQAKKAVDAVLSFLKGKLPKPVASQVEAVLKGDTSGLQGAAGKVGGLLGKKKK
jgi:uncharacterized protein (DUF2267 family)